MTFGAPMVVHSEAPQQLYTALAAMERRAEGSSSRRRARHQLQFHNLARALSRMPSLFHSADDIGGCLLMSPCCRAHLALSLAACHT